MQLAPISLERMILEAAAAARPPEDLTVSQAAEKFRRLNNPGAYVGPLKNDLTPYLIEPMDTLQSLDFTGMAFAGPAQCAKTEMALNWLTYSVKCDPADMMIVQTSNTTARDFSMRRIDRLHRHSPDVGGDLAPNKQADNVFDKHYRSGMMMTLSWPAINELSGKPIPRLWLTDYDRMPADIDGEGSPFDLARKRATTFGRHGMCAAESSPGFIIENPKWIRTSPHEAPPTKGILGIYNKGDRRRWYWDCVKCHHKFEPTFQLLEWPDTADQMEAAETAIMRCPNCRAAYSHDPNDHMPGKHELNKAGRWIKDGQRWMPDGSIMGTAHRSDIASFWLKGVAAAFAPWKTLVKNYLSAKESLDKTGSEEEMKTTVNTDQGEPYLPVSMANTRVPETIKARALEIGERLVPAGVRFLIATIDVQKNRFVVQVHGIAANLDVYVIDRYEIIKSKRLDEDEEHIWVKPGSYLEDWKLIADNVLASSYELADGSGRRMAVKMTGCDSGGKEGVTEKAYQFVRWLRRGSDVDEAGEERDTPEEQGSYKWDPNMAGRFQLLKGASAETAPRIALSYPDSQRKDRHAGARGEIGVLMMNTNLLKDMVDNRLDRTAPGGRYVFPKWLKDTFYTELTVEIKDAKGKWQNPRKFRNESWDLLAYCNAIALMPMIGIEHLNWEMPPEWAAPWDENSLVFLPANASRPFEAKPDASSMEDRLKALAASLA